MCESIVEKSHMANSQHCITGEHVYEGATFPGIIPAKALDKLKETIFDDLDIIVGGYPKTGTTVLQEIVFLVNTQGDFETSDKLSILARIPFLEVEVPGRSMLKVALETSPPRLMKSHLPTKFFKETLTKSACKFVIGMRNPKDMLVSNFHFYRMNDAYNLFKGTWDEYFTIFKDDRLAFGNFFESVLSWWKIRDKENILIVKFEDIVENPHEVIRRVANHLKKDIPDELVKRIADRIVFKNMKNIPTLNYTDAVALHQEISPFMRKGEIGDWKNYFNDEQNKLVDDLYQEHCVKNGLTFQFESRFPLSGKVI